LEKLGFPWILSSEMSLFNGLRANFAEPFIRAPYGAWTALGSRVQSSAPLIITCSVIYFGYTHRFPDRSTMTHISAFGKQLLELSALRGCFHQSRGMEAVPGQANAAHERPTYVELKLMDISARYSRGGELGSSRVDHTGRNRYFSTSKRMNGGGILPLATNSVGV
jgi:hypothetical protein